MDGQRKALIVASDQYDHEGLRHLVAPAADAAALAGVLGDPKIGDFDVQVVRNESAHAVQGHVEELLLEARPEDVLLLHFSCHGLKSESGELFFAARNTRPNRLGSTAIAADFVQRCMRASRSRSIVLLLDCCYGGAFGQGVAVRASGDVNVLDSFSGGKLGGGRGRAVITASNAMEYAFEGERLADDHGQRPSVFTSALVDGLATGDADRDEDGWVSLNELYDYVFDRVRAETPHQTPSRDIEMSGDLYLARSRRRRIRPLPIPPDLQAAVTDPNVYTRLGAVAELRSRLGSDDLPMAMGAYEALVSVARTDIKYVAESAADAVHEAALQVEERHLNFGRAAQGSDPPHRTVHLLGPPLARECTFEPSHSWIRFDETAGGLDVSVDTAHVGHLRGLITIKGPTSQIPLPVEVHVTPAHGNEEQRHEGAEPTPGGKVPPELVTPAQVARPQPPLRREPLAVPLRSPGTAADVETEWEHSRQSPEQPQPEPAAVDDEGSRMGDGVATTQLQTATGPPPTGAAMATDSGRGDPSAIVRGPGGSHTKLRLGLLLLALAALAVAVVVVRSGPAEPDAQQTLTGHTDTVNDVAVTPDGERVISGSFDNTVKVWDLATGEEQLTLTGHTDSVRAVAVTPDGERVISGSDDNTVKVWDLATGEEQQTLTGHTDWVRAVAVTPDGERVISGSDDDTVKVWDLATGEEQLTLTGHTDSVKAVAVTPDGERVISGSDDNTVKVWDLATGEEQQTLTGHTTWVNDVAVAPDGERVISGSSDNTVKVWDLATGEEQQSLTGTGEVFAVAVTPDGERVIGGSADGTVEVWDVATGEEPQS